MMSFLKKFAENIYVNLVAGLALFITAAIEIVRTLDEGVIGVHHGVAVFAFLEILKVLHNLQHGAEHVSRFRD